MYETYTVKPGDTLYGISNQFGVSVTELAELNGIKGSNLSVGTVLKIPSKSGTNPNNMFMYTVQKGDTLYSIARKYNTTVNDIINLNYLKNNNLSVGQVIRIPENYYNYDEMSAPNYITYTVKPGDTLYSIALNNGINVDTIISDNVLPNNNLNVGQVLRLRVNDDEVLECFGSDFDIPEEVISNVTYTVKSGDNLYSIARKYNTSVSEIVRLNNLNGTSLSIGQKLLIPSSNASSSTAYTVQKGDSLYSIARKFNTTVDSIKSKNNLKSNLLNIGQILII